MTRDWYEQATHLVRTNLEAALNASSTRSSPAAHSLMFANGLFWIL
jgi:hypothetical protein